jgi:diguanylate cyclase (GGDEF)-like protein
MSDVRNSVRFALLGVAAGVVMPLGLVLYALGQAGNPDHSIDPIDLFLVMVVGGCSALGVLGWLLGRKEDRLASQNRALAQLTSRLQALSTTDPLTGIPNRRALDDRLENEIERSKRYGAPLAVVMIDLDRFKRLNDRHGHAAGDAMLREVARLLDAEKRRGDTIARYGGEEFVALLPHADASAAQAWAERARARLATTAIEMGGTLLRTTASFGVAASERHGPAATSSALLEAADQALYQAKERGRNRVVVAPPPAEVIGADRIGAVS